MARALRLQRRQDRITLRIRHQDSANDYANEIEADQRRGIWLDPKASKTTVADWAVLWANTVDVEMRTTSAGSATTSNPAGAPPHWATSPPSPSRSGSNSFGFGVATPPRP